jgi:hypothetical protein
MTDTPDEEYEDTYPLLGAIGPYLSFTTGHMNPIEPESFDEPNEVVYPEEDDSSTDYWEDEEQ